MVFAVICILIILKKYKGLARVAAVIRVDMDSRFRLPPGLGGGGNDNV